MTEETNIPSSGTPCAAPDGRQPWEWKTKFNDAMPQIKCEAKVLASYLGFFGILTILCFSLTFDFTYSDGNPPKVLLNLSRRSVLVWLVGSVGGTVFAIKWLVHSVASGLWHQDRLLWRVFVPLTGGIYALVVLGLLETGFIGGRAANVDTIDMTREMLIAFLAGYFADGVSGLLTNVANAIFGKVEKK